MLKNYLIILLLIIVTLMVWMFDIPFVFDYYEIQVRIRIIHWIPEVICLWIIGYTLGEDLPRFLGDFLAKIIYLLLVFVIFFIPVYDALSSSLGCHLFEFVSLGLLIGTFFSVFFVFGIYTSFDLT